MVYECNVFKFVAADCRHGGPGAKIRDQSQSGNPLLLLLLHSHLPPPHRQHSVGPSDRQRRGLRRRQSLVGVAKHAAGVPVRRQWGELRPTTVAGVFLQVPKINLPIQVPYLRSSVGDPWHFGADPDLGCVSL
jgi:hypothetical protein